METNPCFRIKYLFLLLITQNKQSMNFLNFFKKHNSEKQQNKNSESTASKYSNLFYTTQIDNLTANDKEYQNISINKNISDFFFENEIGYNYSFYENFIGSQSIKEDEKIDFIEKELQNDEHLIPFLKQFDFLFLEEESKLKRYINHLQNTPEKFSFDFFEFTLKNKLENCYDEIQKYLKNRNNGKKYFYETSIPIVLFDLGFKEDSFILLKLFVNEYFEGKIDSINDESFFEETNPFAYLALNNTAFQAEITELAFSYFASSHFDNHYCLKKFLFYTDKNKFFTIMLNQYQLTPEDISNDPGFIKNDINWNKHLYSPFLKSLSISNFDQYLAETTYNGEILVKTKLNTSLFDTSIASYPLNYELFFNTYIAKLLFKKNIKGRFYQNAELFGDPRYSQGSYGYTLNFVVEEQVFSIYFETETNWLEVKPFIKLLNTALKTIHSEFRFFFLVEDVDCNLILEKPDDVVDFIKDLNFETTVLRKSI